MYRLCHASHSISSFWCTVCAAQHNLCEYFNWTLTKYKMIHCLANWMNVRMWGGETERRDGWEGKKAGGEEEGEGRERVKEGEKIKGSGKRWWWLWGRGGIWDKRMIKVCLILEEWNRKFVKGMGRKGDGEGGMQKYRHGLRKVFVLP